MHKSRVFPIRQWNVNGGGSNRAFRHREFSSSSTVNPSFIFSEKGLSINHGLTMAPRLQDLIDFLLAEIALCGDQGMQATLLHYANLYCL